MPGAELCPGDIEMNKTNKSPTFLSSEEKERLWKEGGKEEELDEGLYSMSDVLWRKLKQGLGKLEDVLRIFFLKKFFFLLFSSFKCLMNYVQANIKVKYMPGKEQAAGVWEP